MYVTAFHRTEPLYPTESFVSLARLKRRALEKRVLGLKKLWLIS